MNEEQEQPRPDEAEISDPEMVRLDHDIEEEGVDNEEEFASPDEARRLLFSELSRFIAEQTRHGLFPVVAYGLDFKYPNRIGVLTCPIRDFPLALKLIDRAYGKPVNPGRFIPLPHLDSIARKNRVMDFRFGEFPDLDSTNSDHRRLIMRLMNFCMAAHWRSRAFMRVDMVGFSQLSTATQLSMRMSLGLTVSQCIDRMKRLAQQDIIALEGFNRISTGDGFYMWSQNSSSEGAVSLFLLMLFLMAHVDLMRAEHEDAVLQLKAAFAIGEAYTFPYYGLGNMPGDEYNRFMPDAIGPSLNLLCRLLEPASPGQILVAPFEAEGRDYRPGEKLDLETMLTRIRMEILPRELAPRDPIKASDLDLGAKPETPFRISDKHGTVHYCTNVAGLIPARGPDGLALQPIGLLPDETPEVLESSFRGNSL